MIKAKEVLIINGEKISGLYMVCKGLITTLDFAESLTKGISLLIEEEESMVAIGISHIDGALAIAVNRKGKPTIKKALIPTRKHRQSMIWALENILKRLMLELYEV